MTQILAQVQGAGVRLLDVIIIHIKLLAVVLEFNENFSWFNVGTTRLLMESDCSTESATMHQPHFLTFGFTVVQTVTIFVGFCLEIKKRKLLDNLFKLQFELYVISSINLYKPNQKKSLIFLFIPQLQHQLILVSTGYANSDHLI